MKLCRYGLPGKEQPGLLDTDGRIRDLSKHIDDITPAVLSPRMMKHLSELDIDTLPLVEEGVRYGIPVNGIPKIVAVGLNYEDHAKEAGLPVPTEPITFMKAVSSLTGPNDDVMLPQDSTHSDWEVELGVIIGQRMSYVAEEDALSHVAGYVLANDVSERFNQKQRGSQWSKGKGHDTFCPVGPWLVTADELGDPQDLAMYLDVNGERKQTGNTRTMIFTVAEALSYISRYMTLMPGDLVITGTPPGVGEGQKPNAQYLAAGDIMELGIDGLGTQRQTVIAWSRTAIEGDLS
ncbi:fumarylacetoacetate hydrolase family protein [Parvularcula flava]|uniref:Fumarylacetoacetate hydrolase family protein n=1 Tax=Aquisalinus luteolus TaxID=1566827 RepID=A0A8J3EPR0_9PROT|nr:fumarylacetoacetate hydrolase family protein [Aquisalinus luteolus]NHK26424.1 fumarylacetoacetate hydrolase family protein [Aquisalinus luteolus]GGH92292.1 ureidoglycolate lyase [Aquisalinus luteolus]